MNESEMVIPLEGDETGFVPETNDVDEVKGIIIGVQVEEDDRTEAHLACEEEDKLRRHDTVRMVIVGLFYHYVNFFQIESTDELPVGREDNVSRSNVLCIDVNIFTVTWICNRE